MAELTKLQEDIIRFYHQNPFIEYLHAQVIPTAGGGVRLELTVEEEHTNLYAIVHGGVLMTLADTACGAACLAKNKKVVTISLGMEFMHSIPLTTKIVAIGRVLHDGRRTMTCESEMRDENGKLYAKGHGTFYVLGLFEEEDEEQDA